jgi:hypothetical protein
MAASIYQRSDGLRGKERDPSATIVSGPAQDCPPCRHTCRNAAGSGEGRCQWVAIAWRDGNRREARP